MSSRKQTTSFPVSAVSEEAEGLTHEKLKSNITSVIRGIPKKSMKIFLREHITEMQYM
jgi:hypothetical protein